MKITEIVFSMTRLFKPDLSKTINLIEFDCRLKVNEKLIQYRRIFPDTDFESRAERYFNYMRDEIIEKIKED